MLSRKKSVKTKTPCSAWKRQGWKSIDQIDVTAGLREDFDWGTIVRMNEERKTWPVWKKVLHAVGIEWWN